MLSVMFVSSSPGAGQTGQTGLDWFALVSKGRSEERTTSSASCSAIMTDMLNHLLDRIIALLSAVMACTNTVDWTSLAPPPPPLQEIYGW